MTELSKPGKDTLLFPQVGVTVRFIPVNTGQGKVRIDAPHEIIIFHNDDEHQAIRLSMLELQLDSLPKEVRHKIRNELHSVSMGLHLLRELGNQGLDDQAAENFESIQQAIVRLMNNAEINRLIDKGK